MQKTSIQKVAMKEVPIERALLEMEDDVYVSLPLLSVAEAAKYLGVGRKAVYQLIEWGEIRGLKVNGPFRIEKNSLANFRASRKMI